MRHPIPFTGAFAVAVLLLTACGPAVSPPSPSPTHDPTPTARPTATLPPGVTAAFEFDTSEFGVYGVVGFDDSVWVEHDEHGEGRLSRIDPATGTITHVIEGSFPQRIGDDLWFERDGEVVEADPSTGQERAAHPMPMGGNWTIDGEWLWVASEDAHTLVRSRLGEAAIQDEIPLPEGEPKALVAYEGSIWVVIDGANVILRVDAATADVTATIETGSRPHTVAIAFGSLWVTDHGEPTMERVDASSGTIAARIKGVGVNVAVTATDDAIWVATNDGLARVDPATNEITHEIELGSGDHYAVAMVGDHLWLSQPDRARVLQIEVP